MDPLYKEKLMEVMKAFAHFCQEHHLRYYACGGTMLGAVRHQGFIPWDDDIDLYMPREDYDRMLQLRHTLAETPYQIVSPETTENYYCPWAKMMDRNSTILEYPYYHHTISIYVDIFPLDYFQLPKEQILQKQREYFSIFSAYLKSLKTYSPAELLSLLCKGKIKELLKGIYFQTLFRTRRKTLYQNFLRAKTYHSTSEEAKTRAAETEKPYTENCVCLSSSIGKVFKSEWFEDCIDHPFEDITLPVPRKYDEYLTLIYKNWRQLPPPEKQVTVHEYCYINLNQQLTYTEVKEILSENKNKCTCRQTDKE